MARPDLKRPALLSRCVSSRRLPAHRPQTGGHVEFTNRGFLDTVREFVAAAGGVRITGKWTYDAAPIGDFLQVLTRTDGVPQGTYGEVQTGVECFASAATSAVGVTGWGSDERHQQSATSTLSRSA